MRLLSSLILLSITIQCFNQEHKATDTLIIQKDTLSVKQDTVINKRDTVTIIGVGDIMMGTNYPENKLPSNNGNFLMKEVESVLKNADLTFGNLEGTLLDNGGQR